MNVSALPLSCAVHVSLCDDTRSTTVLGLGDGWPTLLVALTCVAVAAVVIYIRRRKRR